MSYARRLARATARQDAKKTPLKEVLGGLSALQGALPGLSQLEEVIGEAKRLALELEKARDDFAWATVELSDAAYELRKQRAVFLRFLYSPDCLIPTGPSGLNRFLASETRYRAEYDVLQAFAQLADREVS